MKLQYLAVIFIIIVLPIILLLSYYMQLQIETITLQTSYDTKLVEATKEAIEAYEINTVEWNENYSEVLGAKRREVTATMNAFIDSLANKMGVGGASRNTITTYVPAVAFTLYDGYFLYTPTSVDNIEINEDTGVAELDEDTREPKTSGYKEFKHVLRPFMKYSARYKSGSKYITVNYTLDNYISVFGDFGDKSGYLINPSEITEIPNTEDSEEELKYNSRLIGGEVLRENVAYKESASDADYKVDEFQYVYNTEGKKTYIEKTIIDGVETTTTFILSDKGVKTELAEVSKIDETCKYTKVSVLDSAATNGDKYIEYYQVLNPGTIQCEWYKKVESGNQIFLDKVDDEIGGVKDGIFDYSSVNYYVEAYAFSNWVKNNSDLKHIKTTDRVKEDGSDYYPVGTTAEYIFSDTSFYSPESDSYEIADFTIHRKEVIQETIRNNLNQAIYNYGLMNGQIYDFKMPQMTPDEWEQIESNVSIITFLQGVPVGTKYYNNYAIASSTNNRDFVNTRDIIFRVDEEYYHKVYCNDAILTNIKGYRSSDFTIRRTEVDNGTGGTKASYYYPHATANHAQMACYYCIVDRSNYAKTTDSSKIDIWETAHYTAIGRERYVQRKTQL